MLLPSLYRRQHIQVLVKNITRVKVKSCNNYEFCRLLAATVVQYISCAFYGDFKLSVPTESTEHLIKIEGFLCERPHAPVPSSCTPCLFFSALGVHDNENAESGGAEKAGIMFTWATVVCAQCRPIMHAPTDKGDRSSFRHHVNPST